MNDSRMSTDPAPDAGAQPVLAPAPHGMASATRGREPGACGSRDAGGWWAAAARSQRWPLLALICLALLLGFAFQGTRGLWSTDEGRYVDGALQMLDSGNFLVPAYSPIEVNLSKPPLTYWMIAGSIKVFGRNTWAARLPYALAFVLTIWLLYGMGRRLVPDKPWLAGLVYGLSLVPFAAANVVSTDELLTLWEALAMYGFIASEFGPDPRRVRGFLVLMWVGWGAAFLTKGPPGLLPLLAVIPFVAIRGGGRGVARLFSPAGVAAFLAIGFGWFAIVVVSVPWALHYFVHREVYDRIFTAVQHRNPGAWGWLKVYLPTLALGLLPWWPILAPGWVARWWRHASRPRVLQMDARLLLWLWFAIPLIVFCFAQSRLPAYVLPLFLPLSLLLARGLEHRIDLGRTGQRVRLAVWIIVLLTFKGGIAYAVKPPLRDEQLVARELGAKVAPGAYSAVVFVEATAKAYDIEESTPWGIRLYLDKPVYAIAWQAPGGPATLCRAMQRAGATLVVVSPGLASARTRIAQTLARCTHAPVGGAGAWSGHALLLAGK